MQVSYERCAAVDAGKDEIAVAVRVPGKGRDGRKDAEADVPGFLRGAAGDGAVA